jgi:amino acid transporter
VGKNPGGADPPELLNFFSVTSWTLYLATVVGLLYLRVKEPHLDRPYRTWLSTPIIFCLVSQTPTRELTPQVAMFLLLMPIFAAPWEALAAFIFMATGVPMYYLTARSRARSSGKGYARLDNEDDGVRATLGSGFPMPVAS